MSKSKVYFTKEITPKSLIKIYEALNTELKGKVAVKISTGEAGGHNFLDSNLIIKIKWNNSRVQHCISRKKKYNRSTLANNKKSWFC